MTNKNKSAWGKKRLINFTGEQDLMLRVIAQETGLSVSSVVRLAVKNLFDARTRRLGLGLPIDTSESPH